MMPRLVGALNLRALRNSRIYKIERIMYCNMKTVYKTALCAAAASFLAWVGYKGAHAYFDRQLEEIGCIPGNAGLGEKREVVFRSQALRKPVADSIVPFD